MTASSFGEYLIRKSPAGESKSATRSQSTNCHVLLFTTPDSESLSIKVIKTCEKSIKEAFLKAPQVSDCRFLTREKSNCEESWPGNCFLLFMRSLSPM